MKAKFEQTVAKPGFDYFCHDSDDGGYYRMRIISIQGDTAKALKENFEANFLYDILLLDTLKRKEFFLFSF